MARKKTARRILILGIDKIKSKLEVLNYKSIAEWGREHEIENSGLIYQAVRRVSKRGYLAKYGLERNIIKWLDHSLDGALLYREDTERDKAKKAKTAARNAYHVNV